MATESHPFERVGTAPAAATLPPGPRAAPQAAARPASYESALFGTSALSLLRELIEQLATLVRQELALAGAELKRTLGSLQAGVASLAVAAALIFAGLLVLLAAAVWALSTVLAGWLAALIVGVGVLAIGTALLLAARRQLRPVAPQRSSRSLRRDRDMVARHLS